MLVHLLNTRGFTGIKIEVEDSNINIMVCYV